MTTWTSYTIPAGADTGAVLAATRSAELNLTLASAEASHLGTHLATRRPVLPVRLARTWTAGVVAARTEWVRREPAPAGRAAGRAPAAA